MKYLLLAIMLLTLMIQGFMNSAMKRQNDMVKEVITNQAYIVIKLDSVLKYKCKEHGNGC